MHRLLACAPAYRATQQGTDSFSRPAQLTWNSTAGTHTAACDVRSPRSAMALDAEGTLSSQPCTESGSCCGRVGMDGAGMQRERRYNDPYSHLHTSKSL